MCRRRIAIPIATLAVAATALGAGTATAAPVERTFVFTYSARVAPLPSTDPVRVWLPVPQTDADQRVSVVGTDLPAGTRAATEPRFGNRMLSFALPPGHPTAVAFSLTYRVTRQAVAGPVDVCPVPRGAAMSDAAALLRPDRLVPVGGEPAGRLLAGRTLSPRQLFDAVDDHLQYRKDRPGWGTGDATWACRSGFGNCTDFHSLFISLARSERLPAVFQIGFAIGQRPAGRVGGYHCWAWVRPTADGGWLPVDVADANLHPDRRDYYFGHLDPDRVTFTVGRDLDLVPQQDGPPLNYFVYPYAEAGGRPLPPAGIVTTFTYGAVP